MPLPENITIENLLSAINKIDEEGIPKNADSQYYDVIFNKKKYPPKLVVSYANLFANGEILDRNSFNGGLDTECFNLLEKNNFKIENKVRKMSNSPKVWFVAQGSTFTPNKGMKFLWAPETDKKGKSKFYWDNVLKVKKGDIIFNYSKGIKGVSLAKNDGYKSNNKDENSSWVLEGYRVDIEITLLNPIVSGQQIIERKDDFNKYLLFNKNKPFDKNGKVNEGYLYEFTKEAGKFIRDLYGKPFGDKLIDDFFDSVNLKNNNPNLFNNMVFKYDSFHENSLSANFFINKKLCLRFISSLFTKPFVILTGLSGSGKTKLAQAFAMWVCQSEHQYCIVPVGADWTNREPLLGFPNALNREEYCKPENKVLDLIIDAINNPKLPYFLILDEMNLSHVERYFADFLSVMESKKNISLHAFSKDLNGVPHEITLPDNLFIIGTVNIDETTYMFSPKVLDRANVIEFRITKKEIEDFLKNTNKIDLNKLLEPETKMGLGASMAEDFVKTAKSNFIGDSDSNEKLIVFFNELKKAGAEFGYRSASDISRLISILNSMTNNTESDGNNKLPNNDFIDIAIMQKLLPKLHGSRSKLNPILLTLAKFCVEDGIEIIKDKHKEKVFIDSYLKEVDDKENTLNIKILYPISFEKIVRMYNNALTNGYTSYAEA